MTLEAQPAWDDLQPIYRQLRDRLLLQILQGRLREGERLPAVRVLAKALGLAPLTVLHSYQHLASERLLERRRGRGTYVAAGALASAHSLERQRFLAHEWPRVCQMMATLGLSFEELPRHMTGKR